MRTCCIFFFMVCWTPFLLDYANAEKSREYSPVPGEKLTFQVKWSIIPAGTAVLEIHPQEDFNGSPASHFSLTIRTDPVIDVFYKVRDRIDSYTDPALTHSLAYKKKKEGKNPRDIVVRFDWYKNDAQYSNFGRVEQPIPLQSGTFDPLSGFYFTRFQDLQPGMEITRPITDGKRKILGRVRVLGREQVTVRSGTYDTYLLEPELRHIRGVFEKSPNARMLLWVTADERRLPVKLKSKVIVGSFVAELVKIEYLN